MKNAFEYRFVCYISVVILDKKKGNKQKVEQKTVPNKLATNFTHDEVFINNIQLPHSRLNSSTLFDKLK